MEKQQLILISLKQNELNSYQLGTAISLYNY